MPRTVPAAIAADYVLPVFGNANMDKTIDENVFVIDRNIGFLRHFVGVAYLSKLLHIDLFPTLNPEEINKKYLEEFQSISYRGFYIDPPLEGN